MLPPPSNDVNPFYKQPIGQNLMAAKFIGNFIQPTHGEYRPDASAAPPPLHTGATDITNFAGNKFTRGWLSGHGGAELDAIGSTNFGVKASPYNNAISADFTASRGGFMRDRIFPSWENPRIWGPQQTFYFEDAPQNTWTHAVAGEADPISGMPSRALVFSGLDAITAAPISQYYARGQAAIGGDGLPSVSEAQRKKTKFDK